MSKRERAEVIGSRSSSSTTS